MLQVEKREKRNRWQCLPKKKMATRPHLTPFSSPLCVCISPSPMSVGKIRQLFYLYFTYRLREKWGGHDLSNYFEKLKNMYFSLGKWGNNTVWKKSVFWRWIFFLLPGEQITVWLCASRERRNPSRRRRRGVVEKKNFLCL